MRIGIDAKWYFEGPPSGKRVVRNLVDSMIAIDDKNEYVIFLNKKHRHETFPVQENSRVKLCYVWAGNNALSNIFVLPFYSHRYKVDATLYQTFISPFDPAKRIAYIHDVLFLSNPEYYTLMERIYFAPLKFLTRWANAIITVSKIERERLLAFGYSIDPDKITVAYHGVEKSFRPYERHFPEAIQMAKEKFNLPEKFILFVGRLNLRKNVEHLLKAIPLLKNRNIPLVIVGADDWKKSNHQRTIREYGIESRVLFKGAIYNELSEIYSMATVFCFPSYAESFGLPPLESMASGVPVVTSNTTSLPEICGEAGTYVDPKRPEQIAAAIDNLLSNHQLYEEKKRLGLQRAKNFTWESASQTILNCLQSCK